MDSSLLDVPGGAGQDDKEAGLKAIYVEFFERVNLQTMPEISRFFGIIVAMYYNEHNPPHFHARYGDFKIEIEIRTLSVLAGKFPPRALGLLVEWATQHQEELMGDWDLARQDAELRRIAPLE